MNLRTPTHRRHPAFTMVELLVVVALLLVLAALLFIGIGTAKRAANKVTCNNNLRQIGVGLAGFVADNGRYPSSPSYPGDDDVMFDREILLQLNAPYTDRLDSTRALSTRSMPGLKDSIAEIFICPTDNFERGRTSFKRSYAFCPWACNLSQFAGDIPRGFANLTPNRGVTPAAIISPSTSAIIVEWHAGTDTIENCLGHGNHWVHDRGGEASGRDPKDQCHSGTQNVLFCDGHVENVPIMDNPTFTRKYWPLDTRFNPSNP